MSHDHKNLLFVGPNPLVTLAEWIPFGTNNLILLEEKLEAHNKWGECLLTALIDEDPETSTVELEEPESKVMPVDGKDGEWIAFQAEVNYKATGGEHQVERFTTRVGESGIVTCDLELLETNGNADRHSLDDIASVLADLVEDTSSLMNTLLNNFQRRLLDLVYCDQASQRDKYVLILARSFLPETRGPRLFGRSRLPRRDPADHRPSVPEQCLHAERWKQVDCRYERSALYLERCRDLPARARALLLRSKHPVVFDEHVLAHVWMTWDRLSQVKEMIRDDGIRKIMEIQDIISDLTGDISMFDTILAYVNRSAAKGDEILPVIRNESMAEEEDLLSGLRLGDEVAKLRNRVDDAHLIVEGLQKEIQSVRALAQTLGEKETYRISQFMN